MSGLVLSLAPVVLPDHVHRLHHPDRVAFSEGVTIEALPTRYRLRHPLAITWRADDVLQLGLDADGLVLHGVPRGVEAAVQALVESRTVAELAYLAPALPRDWVPWLVERLGNAGLLSSESGPLTPLGLVGSGPLAEATLDLLHRVGLTDVVQTAHTAARPLPWRPSVPDGATLHWSQLSEGLPALTIVATDSQEPDRSLTDALSRAGRAYLVVRLEADRAVVGPLVVPGATPCVRCQDLLRCRYDPSWPLLVAQLCRERAATDHVRLAWAAATTVAQVRCHLAGQIPDAAGRTLELGPDHTLRTREWPVHPDCGCVLAVA